MLKNPIPKVTNQLQHRAIGIVNGKFTPLSSEQFNRGFLIDNKDEKIETVVLGKALSLLKKHIDLKKSYYWIVYPKNKNTQNLHLQVAGIWDPYQLNDFPNDSSTTNFSKLLEELDLKDNYFSVRGELVFVNTQKKEIVIKICSDIKSKKLEIPIFIGTDKPFLISACLWPSICKSKVSTKAEHSAAFALSTNRLAKS